MFDLLSRQPGPDPWWPIEKAEYVVGQLLDRGTLSWTSQNICMQLGQEYFAYTLKKDEPLTFIYLTRFSIAGKESFSEQALIRSARFVRETIPWRHVM